MANYIIKRKKKKQDETKSDIIMAAAKIIKTEIRELTKSNGVYSTTEEIASSDKGNEWVPESLKLLLSYLIPAEIMQLAVGQCIVQAVKPRSVLCPIPLRLGVELEKTFGSKWLLNHPAKLGFSFSADEVPLFKQSASQYSKEYHNEALEKNNNESFIQWSADNVDHNILILTGKGTFHGMRIISMTSSTSGSKSPVVIKHLKKKLPSTAFIDDIGIPILNFLGSSAQGLRKLKLKPSSELMSPYSLPAEWNYDMLWHVSRFNKISSGSSRHWSRFMQDITKRLDFNKEARINFLPMIDLNPGDESCIYSALKFITEEAKKFGILVPCVTFDQPLWLKAIGIIAETGLKIVARLGGFYTTISFPGNIGKLMAGSSTEELLVEVYAENSMEHMLSGKAVSRFLRGHLRVESRRVLLERFIV